MFRGLAVEVRRAVEADGAAVPHARSYWVAPGRLLAGAFPSDRDNVRAQSMLSSLVAAGIRGIIDLTEDREFERYNFYGYREAWERIGVESFLRLAYYQRPIVDLDIPTPEEMKGTLEIMDRSIQDGFPLYVHCIGGIGRTGTVVGCWLARHGVASGTQIIDLIGDLRRNDPNRHFESPTTDRQKKFVCDWREGI